MTDPIEAIRNVAIGEEPGFDRCPLACPHGDRCTLARDHDNGCNHQRCGCNEPNSKGRLR
jgi:hypothetical protein